MPNYTELMTQALDLTPEQRADLAQLLIVSLKKNEPDQSEIEDLAAARQQRLLSGNGATYSAAETLGRIRHSLEQRNNK